MKPTAAPYCQPQSRPQSRAGMCIGSQHAADLGDLPGEKGQHHTKGQEQGGEDKGVDLSAVSHGERYSFSKSLFAAPSGAAPAFWLFVGSFFRDGSSMPAFSRRSCGPLRSQKKAVVSITSSAARSVPHRRKYRSSMGIQRLW